jgi:hypothetical protein
LKGTSHGLAPDVALMLRSPLFLHIVTPNKELAARLSTPILGEAIHGVITLFSAHVDLLGGKGSCSSCGRSHRSCGSGTGSRRSSCVCVMVRQAVQLCIREPRAVVCELSSHETMDDVAFSCALRHKDLIIDQPYRRELDIGDGDGLVLSPPTSFLCM